MRTVNLILRRLQFFESEFAMKKVRKPKGKPVKKGGKGCK